MKKTLLTLFTIGSLFLAGCIDNKMDFPVPGGKVPTESTSTFSGDYQPFTVGSSWTYKSTTLNPFDTTQVFVDTTTNTMTNQTRTFATRTFRKMESVIGADADATYMGIINGVYYFHNEEIVNGQFAMDLPYLDDRLDAGKSFTLSIAQLPNNPPMRYVTTILEKGITKKILGKDYQNVIHSKVDLQAKEKDNWETGMTFDFYAAKNLGLVLIIVTSEGVELSRTELISHIIK